MLKTYNLIDKYKRFIITRSDFIYQLPHPQLDLLNPDFIWIPDGEHYGGFTDRHAILSQSNIETYLNIFNSMVIHSNKYFFNMLLFSNSYNIETLIKFHLIFHNKINLVRHFPYIMYAVRNHNGTTRWSKGEFSFIHNYYIKYSNEYYNSSHYKYLFHKSNLSITDFYKSLIYY